MIFEIYQVFKAWYQLLFCENLIAIALSEFMICWLV